MLEQVSIQAYNRAGLFWDLPEGQAVPTLAVAFHRATLEGSRACILPACSVDIVHIWNGTQPKKKESDAGKASRDYMFGAGGS